MMNNEELNPWSIISTVIAVIFIVRTIYYYIHYR